MAPSAPLRQDRKKCWEDRDLYFSCLDTAKVIKPGEEGKTCTAEKKSYDKSCAKSWIEYFNTRRVLAEQQKEMLAEAERQRAEAQKKGFKS